MFGSKTFKPDTDQEVIAADQLRAGDYVYDHTAPGKGVVPGDEATITEITPYRQDGDDVIGVTADWPTGGDGWEWTMSPDTPVLIRRR